MRPSPCSLDARRRGALSRSAHGPRASGSSCPPQLKAAIDNLGKFDAATRTAAARTVRRAAASAGCARADGGGRRARGRLRSLPRAGAAVGVQRSAGARRDGSALDDPNDRLRTVAYAYFEHNKERGMAAAAAKNARQGRRRVRPPGADPRARRLRRRSGGQTALTALVMRGQDLYRSAVIEALGDYHADLRAGADHSSRQAATARCRKTPSWRWARSATSARSRSLRRCSNRRRACASRRSPRRSACSASTASRTRSSSIDTMKFAIENIGFQDLLRASARASARWRRRARQDAAARAARSPAFRRAIRRASPVALAFGTRRAAQHAARPQAARRAHGPAREPRCCCATPSTCSKRIYEEERFFATVRRGYWQAPAGSRAQAADALIQALEF